MGILLASLASLCEEVFSSIGKYEEKNGREGILAMTFLSLLGSAIFFVLLLLLGQSEFRFAAASFPTFGLRFLLEVVQTYVSIKAIVVAERSTFSFIRSGTIPLLLVVDTFVGYVLHPLQLLGMGVILMTLLFLVGKRTLHTKGVGLIIFSTLNAVITISLYKYNITHYNSVIGEQLTLVAMLMIVYFASSLVLDKENPLRLLRQPIFSLQAGVQGLGGVLASFALLFAAPSIIIAAHRSSAMVWTIISGRLYFHETNLVQKIAGALLLMVGIFLLAF